MDAVVSLLRDQQCAEHAAAIVDHLVANFDPSLGPNNRNELMALWTTCLQYLDDCASDPTERNLANVACLLPVLCKLALIFPQYAGQCLQDVVIQKHEAFKSSSMDYPGLDTVRCSLNYDLIIRFNRKLIVNARFVALCAVSPGTSSLASIHGFFSERSEVFFRKLNVVKFCSA